MIDKEAYFFQILEWTHKWTYTDVSILDSLLKDSHANIFKEKKVGDHILTQFLNEKDAWKRCMEVLEFSGYQKTKYFVLNVLREFIKIEWDSLPYLQCIDLKEYILTLLMEKTEVSELSEEDEKMLDVINNIVLEVLEYEYPSKWSTFWEDFLRCSRSNTIRRLNSLVILNHMGKKILGTGNQMSWLKEKDIRQSQHVIFTHIFLLCQFALDTSSDSKFLNYSLEVLMQHITWVTPIFIYETDFIEFLIRKLNVVPNGCLVMQLLIKIVHICPKEYITNLVDAFTLYMTYQVQFLSPCGNYKETYAKSNLYKEKLGCLTEFLCINLEKCGELLRRKDTDSFVNALDYLISISEMDDPKLVKLCMQSFIKFLRDLCCDKMERHIYIYQPVLSRLRNLIINKISKPEHKEGRQVFKVINKDDKVQIFKNMKMILVFLTYLDYADTLKIIIKKLCYEICNTGLSAKSLNSLCCAAVVIRGKIVRVKNIMQRCMPAEEEEKFFWTVIRGILTLARLERAISKKIIIAYNLMYVIGEYAVYLNSRCDVLKKILLKLFEFIHDKLNNNDIKTLACKTFIHIAQKCKKRFIKVQPGESVLYFDEILKHINLLLTRLKPQQVFYFYEAVGYITVAHSTCTDEKSIKEKRIRKKRIRKKSVRKKAIQKKRIRKKSIRKKNMQNKIIKERILKLMALQNKKLELKKTETPGGNFLTPKCVKEFIYILRINRSACKGMGFKYKYQLDIIYKKILILYFTISEGICDEVKNKGMDVKRPWVNVMITVKKEILKLISAWISEIKMKYQCGEFLRNFMPNLYTYVLLDFYNCSVPSLREPEVFVLLTTIVNSLKDSATKKIEKFCSFVLDPKASMIIQNYEEFPEINKNCTMFIHAVTAHCFTALTEMFSLNPDGTFKTILLLILRSTEICENATLGLQTLLLLLKKIQHSSVAQQFYQTFYLKIFKDMMLLVINPSHNSGLKYKGDILSHMLMLIEKKHIEGHINADEQDKHHVSNYIYIKFCIASFVQREFQFLTEEQLGFVTNGFFKYRVNFPFLRAYLKDLNILCQEFIRKNKEETSAAISF